MSAAATGNQESLETTLKKFQQLVQELGRECECPICFADLRAAETNPEHKQFMKILFCGHLLCGDCAHTLNRGDSQTCPVCREDITSQIASSVPAKDDAESRPRPKRSIDDLNVQPKSAESVSSSSGSAPDRRPPEGAFVTRYRGQCYVCDASWTPGASVAKHRRVETKTVCTNCIEETMPCAICSQDASLTDVLKNGRAESKRFFCKACVHQKMERGEAKDIKGATHFLSRERLRRS